MLNSILLPHYSEKEKKKTSKSSSSSPKWSTSQCLEFGDTLGFLKQVQGMLVGLNSESLKIVFRNCGVWPLWIWYSKGLLLQPKKNQENHSLLWIWDAEMTFCEFLQVSTTSNRCRLLQWGFWRWTEVTFSTLSYNIDFLEKPHGRSEIAWLSYQPSAPGRAEYCGGNTIACDLD